MKPGSLFCKFLFSLPVMVLVELCQSNQGKRVMHRMTENFYQVPWAPQRQLPRTEVPESPSECRGPRAPLTGVVVRLDG